MNKKVKLLSQVAEPLKSHVHTRYNFVGLPGSLMALHGGSIISHCKKNFPTCKSPAFKTLLIIYYWKYEK